MTFTLVPLSFREQSESDIHLGAYLCGGEIDLAHGAAGDDDVVVAGDLLPAHVVHARYKALSLVATERI